MARVWPVALAIALAGAPARASDEAPVTDVHAFFSTLAQSSESSEMAIGLRQADLWLDSRLLRNTTVRIKLDLLGMPGGFARSTPWLKDAYVRSSWGDTALQVGRFKVPMVTQGLEPAASLATIRRPTFDEGRSGFGNVREPGVMISRRLGSPLLLEAGLFATFERDHVIGEAVAKLSVTPMEHLRLSMSRLQGVAGVSFGSRHRTGLDAELDIGPTKWSAEAIWGSDAERQRLGWLGLAKWRLSPAWEAVAEFVWWRPNNGIERNTTLGLNWAPRQHVRLLLNGVREEHAGVPEQVVLFSCQVGL